jgi:hypothetical protein
MTALLAACLLAPRVLVVGGDAELSSAVQIALAPWGVEVVASAGPAPPSTMPEAARRAEALGSDAQALAVVWAAEGTLWIWDRAGEQLSARPLRAALPLDAGAAASAALSVKTVLRSTLIAPEPERLVPPPAAAPQRVASAWALEAAGGPRIWPSVGWEPRLFATVHWHWLSLGASAGPGASVDTPAFLGRLRDVQVGAAVRLGFGGDRLRAELALGPSLHVTTLDGIARTFVFSVDANRADPSFDAAAALDARVGGHTAVGLFGGADVFLRRQRYLVGDVAVVDLAPVAIDLGLRVKVDLE